MTNKLENKFIEAKSTWTYNTNEDRIHEKCKSVIDKGYDIEVWIISNKGKILETIEY